VSRDLVYKSGTWSWQAHRLGDFSQFLLGRPQPRKITAVSRDNFVGDLPFYSVRETVFMKSFKGFKFATFTLLSIAYIRGPYVGRRLLS